MSISRRLAVVVLALVLIVGSAQATFAQDDATPMSGTPNAGAPTAAGGDLPAIGDEVLISDPETGDATALMTVEEIIDPFEGYSDNRPPDPGNHYVAVEYTITNLIPNDSVPYPAAFLTIGTVQGLLVQPIPFLPLSDTSDTSGIDAFPTDPILGDDGATGTFFYLLPDDTEIDGIYYSGQGSHSILADVDGKGSPTVGDEVTVYDRDRQAYAVLSITSYQDPFEGSDQGDAPETGSRMVSMTVSGANLTRNAIEFGLSQFFVLALDGILVPPTPVDSVANSQVAPLEFITEVGGGESVEGTVFFVLPKDVEVAGIIFSPEPGIVVNIGNPGIRDDATPAADTPDSGTSVTGTPRSGTPPVGNNAPIVGDAVAVYDRDTLEEAARITIENVTDAFEEYGEYSGPAAGTRFVAVGITLINRTEDTTRGSRADSIVLSTTGGRLIPASDVGVSGDSAIVEFPTGPIPVGESVTGTLFYQLPDGVEIGGFYFFGVNHYTLLAEVNGIASPVAGETVTAHGREGDEYAALTIVDYIDPFEDYDQDFAPTGSDRVIAVTVSIENLDGNDELGIGPYRFSVLTGEGLIFITAVGFEPAEDIGITPLDNEDIAGGASIERTIFFSLSEETDVDGIVFSPERDILVNIGNPDE